MKVVVIDDEKIALENLLLKLNRISRITQVEGFQSPDEMLQCLSRNKIDIAFLDINMKKINGLILAKKVKEQSPNTAIIFVTGYSEYAVQAFQLHAEGYLMKPVSEEDIEKELDHIKSHFFQQKKNNKLRIQCFGNFEAFYEEKPIHFQRAKTKELFAYLIDRNGAACNVGMLCGILWEEDSISSSKKSQLRTLISELYHELERCKMADVLVKNRNSYSINTKLVDCDYYRYLDMDSVAVNQYQGEYMSQYPWAEMTLGFLEFQL